MQSHHSKDVVRNITTAAQLESELQLAQAQHGVAVLDVYNAEWSHCKALGETFRRLFTDAGDVVYLRFYSVECNAVLESLEHATGAGASVGPTAATVGHATATATSTATTVPRGVSYAPDTTPAHWSSILKARQRRSRPYFVFYKEGKLRGCVEGIDTPRVVKMVHELCKQQKPAAAYVTNASVLDFWQTYLAPDESEVVWDEFATALQRAGFLRGGVVAPAAVTTTASGAIVLDSHVATAVQLACSCDGDVIAAANVQAWVGDTRTIAEAVKQTLTRLHATTAADMATNDGAQAVDGHAASEDANNNAVVTTGNDTAGGAADCVGDGQSDGNVVTSPGDGVDNDGGAAQNSLHEGDATAGAMAAATATPVTAVAREGGPVWDAVMSLSLSYPCSTRYALSLYKNEHKRSNDSDVKMAAAHERDEDIAATTLASLEGTDTLARHLRRCGVDDAALRALCAAVDAKIRVDMPSYSKLALLLVSCDAAALTRLSIADGCDEVATMCADYYAAVCDGTLLRQYAPIALSALCLCPSAADAHESFFYCAPNGAAVVRGDGATSTNADETSDQAELWHVGDVLLLAALTPLQTQPPSPPDDAATRRPRVVRIVGLPSVIELMTTNNNNDDDEEDGGDAAAVVLSGWYAQLTVEEQSSDMTLLRFVAYAHAAAYNAFVQAHTQRLLEEAKACDMAALCDEANLSAACTNATNNVISSDLASANVKPPEVSNTISGDEDGECAAEV